MTEMERTLEEIGIKVRDEHSQIRSKDDIIKEIYQAVNKFSIGKCQIFVEINPSSLS